MNALYGMIHDMIYDMYECVYECVGPLGTCMDFIQEDISLMTTELHRWEEECRRYI